MFTQLIPKKPEESVFDREKKTVYLVRSLFKI